MKLFVVVVTLIVGAQTAVLSPRQGCMKPTAATATEACKPYIQAVEDVLMNVTDFISGNLAANLDGFCGQTEACIQPYVTYYSCIGEDDYANILDGFLCGKSEAGEYCVESWKNVYSLNGTNPGGIEIVTINMNCKDPLFCNDACKTELNVAKSALGCCLAGVIEFTICGALSQVRFDECSIQIPAICKGVTNAPTTPAPPAPPTSGDSCVDPFEDPDYPATCKANLTAIDNLLVNYTNNSFTHNANTTNITNSIAAFCTADCVRPLVTYYNCTGEEDYAAIINGFICGQYQGSYCLQVWPKIYTFLGGDVSAVTINSECNDPLECSTQCSTELTDAKNSLGCCLAGVTEFTVCGPLEKVRFDECGVSIDDICPGIDLSAAASLSTISLAVLSVVALVVSKLI